MRLIASFLCASCLVACAAEDYPSSAVASRDACFALAKSVDDVTLTTKSLKIEFKRKIKHEMIFNWPAEHHGENYACVANMSSRKITNFTKNGMLLLEGAPEKLRTF